MLGIVMVSGIAASRASAFVGESVVLNAGKTDLTGPAKSIFSNPTFLASEPAVAAGAGEAMTLETSLVAAGALPELGLALPWVAGASVAALGAVVACETIFGGCLEIFGSSSDPAKGPVTWAYVETATSSWGAGNATLLPGVYATSSPAGFTGDSVKCDNDWPTAPPAAQTSHVLGSSYECLVSEVYKPLGRWGVAVRNPAVNRAEQAGGSVSTLPSKSYYNPSSHSMQNGPSAVWSQSVAACLSSGSGCGLTGSERGHLGEKVASEIAGSEVADPYATLTVPSCEGLSAAACVELLEELGLTPSVAYLNWPAAVIPELNLEEPILSLEAQAEKVQELSPATGTKAVTGSKVTVTANPKLAHMPVIVPEDPAPGESAEAYREKRLAPQDPGWTVNPETLGEVNENPHYNPETVVRPGVEPGTRLDPELEHNTDVKVNPADVPFVAGGAGWTPTAIDTIDMSPLSGLSPCGIFPFGLFCWVGEIFTEIGEAGANCPSFNPALPSISGGTESNEIDFCQEPMPLVAEILRPIELFLFVIGLAFLFAKATRVFGPGD